MLRTASKPKLSLSINTATQAAVSAAKPRLSLSTATTPTSPSYTYSHHARSPRSPMPASPTTLMNTSLNRAAAAAGSSYLQVPTYNYVNSSHAKSILKKDSSSSSSSVPRKTCQITAEPTAIHAITPIDDADYWFKPTGRRPW
jgi:hypothetical protein